MNTTEQERRYIDHAHDFITNGGTAEMDVVKQRLQLSDEQLAAEMIAEGDAAGDEPMDTARLTWAMRQARQAIETFIQHETLRMLEALEFITPPECAGLIIETSFAAPSEGTGVFKEVYNRATRQVTFYRAEVTDFPADYAFDFQNGAPPNVSWQEVEI